MRSRDAVVPPLTAAYVVGSLPLAKNACIYMRSYVVPVSIRRYYALLFMRNFFGNNIIIIINIYTVYIFNKNEPQSKKNKNKHEIKITHQLNKIYVQMQLK